MKTKNRITSLFLFLIFLIGLSLILYPTVSDYWNSIYQSKAVATYSEEIANLDEEDYEKLLSEAKAYNISLTERMDRYALTKEQEEKYQTTLKAGDSDVIGYVEIPSIRVVLPIFHGTDELVLQSAVGHIQWTSLPVGGENTHSVISGHRGLPSAKLFTDLDKLVVGDIFMLQVLNTTLTYEVDQINIVEPHQITDLVIQDGEDLCTLVTCTPYGINTHRLLVRGHRVENRPEATMVRLTSEATQIEPLIIAPIVAVPILFILLMIVLFKDDKKGKKKKRRSKIKKEE